MTFLHTLNSIEHKPQLRVAVISDIHGNADALAAAIRIIEEKPIDQIIILGDLFTYNCQPLEVLDLLSSLSKKTPCVFIKGNHDQFYINIHKNQPPSTYKLSNFINESVVWTATQLQGINLEAIFEWRDNYVLGDFLFSHANPFENGNWEYVENDTQCIKAAETLSRSNLKVGIFGHTHRPMHKCYLNETLTRADTISADLTTNAISLLNPGTIGQPRGEGSSFMILDINTDVATIELINFSFDLTRSAELINKARFTQETEKILLQYLRS